MNSLAHRRMTGGMWNQIDTLLVNDRLRGKVASMDEHERTKQARFDAYMRGQDVDYQQSDPPCDGREVS